VSAETVIHYTDDTGQKHIVWFEDMQSVNTKEQFLRKKGIGNFAFWANSYF
jgi:spore germination protein YaaH